MQIHNQTDDTVDQLMDVAKVQLGYDGLHVVNVSSIIDGSSSNVTSDQFAYESINWAFISGSDIFVWTSHFSWLGNERAKRHH